ncbi:MAG: LysR family transcriptional regulator [Butyricicoccus sp.]
MDRNIQKFQAFLKTVEYGSFTRAAEALSYSQSGISHMIQDLEQEWKVSLLERRRGGVRLTSDGSMLLPTIQQICLEYEKLQMQVDELNGLQSGLIRIGTVFSIAAHWLPKIIRAFQQDYPNIDYEFLLGDYDEIEHWILEGRVDCGFLRLPTRPELETIFLAEDRLLVVLPESHPMAGCDRFPVQALHKEVFMTGRKGLRTEVSDFLEKYKIEPKVRFTTWDDTVIMSMVENGLGISILPELSLTRMSYHVVVKELDVPATRQLALALRDKKTASLAVKRFLDYLSFR